MLSTLEMVILFFIDLKCKLGIVEVLCLLEPCFDLILSSSLSMKIQIIGGKITENLGINYFSFLDFIFKFSRNNYISLFLLISDFKNKIDLNPKFSEIFPPMIDFHVK